MPEFYMIIARQLQIFSRFWGEIGLKGVVVPPLGPTRLLVSQTDRQTIIK